MIGNDVVDLGDAECRAGGHHPRFDARVFAAEERALIAASATPERLRWLLWAAKESAFKAARRVDAAIVFAPSRLLVRLDDERSATVEVGGRRLRVALGGGPEHVHAVAESGGDGVVWSAVARVGADAVPGDAARWLVRATLARVLAEPPETFTVEREGRLPVLWRRGRRSAATLSLSHHGRFVAFACEMPPGEGGR